VQYKANLAAAHWKMRQLNRILPRLQDEFEAALNNGRLLQLEAGATSWVEDILAEGNA